MALLARMSHDLLTVPETAELLPRVEAKAKDEPAWSRHYSHIREIAASSTEPKSCLAG